MNQKFNKNAKVEKITTMLGIAVRLIIIDPLFEAGSALAKNAASGYFQL